MGVILADIIGRPPPVYTEEQRERAIELAANGAPLKVIVNEILSNEYDFWLYRQHDPIFYTKFEQARQEGLEHLADALITLSDEEQDVQRARLKSDNYKWLLSKRKPQIYGDSLNVNVNHTVDVGAALQDARQRAGLINARPQEVIEISGVVNKVAQKNEGESDE